MTKDARDGFNMTDIFLFPHCALSDTPQAQRYSKVRLAQLASQRESLGFDAQSVPLSVSAKVFLWVLRFLPPLKKMCSRSLMGPGLSLKRNCQSQWDFSRFNKGRTVK